MESLPEDERSLQLELSNARLFLLSSFFFFFFREVLSFSGTSSSLSSLSLLTSSRSPLSSSLIWHLAVVTETHARGHVNSTRAGNIHRHTVHRHHVSYITHMCRAAVSSEAPEGRSLVCSAAPSSSLRRPHWFCPPRLPQIPRRRSPAGRRGAPSIASL